MIYFKDKNHEYFSEKDEKYISVSELCSKYKPPYDTEYWARHGALKKLIPDFSRIKKQFPSEREAVRVLSNEMDAISGFHKLVQQIKDEWKNTNRQSVSKGNLYHRDAEKMAYIRGIMENPFTKTGARVIKLEKKVGYDNHSMAPNLYELKDGFYPELLLWNEEYRLAGQSDKVFISTVKGERVVDIDDYKTNKRIDKVGFRGEKLLPPLNHLDNCHLTNYSLAISCYAWMLEQFGFKVRHLGFHHYNTLYKTPYLRDEVLTMLAVHSGKLDKSV